MKYLVALLALASVGAVLKLVSGPDSRLAAGGEGYVWTGGNWEPVPVWPDPY